MLKHARAEFFCTMRQEEISVHFQTILSVLSVISYQMKNLPRGQFGVTRDASITSLIQSVGKMNTVSCYGIDKIFHV